MTNKDTSLTTGDSYCLQISTNSSLSCESDISSFSFDKEVANYTNRTDQDELPAFEIRLLSPLGRSPSPIDSDLEFLSSPTKSCITPTRNRKPQNVSSHKDSNNEDFVPLHDINAQISPPSDSDSNNQSICDSPSGGNLETIFEGVFLNTPPKPKVKRMSIGTAVKQRNNLLEKIAINRLNFVPASGDKENNCQTVEEDEIRDSKRMTIDSLTTDDG
ncbi:uncharacterized protein LOC129919087 [Episyrphus balteatus]|uniref:uncharacterized protein LOC129919087 n=1 Tax=Episyrphus balteatus TaxID=286459 RepID=UPI0024868594|nr:uncharacterized protein LOC129919087 [Episyrphus balteatus]